ncbi:MAG: HAD family hydrolase [Lachnospiraceae bacterium]
MKLEGAVFDLDGTLLDSMGIWDSVGERYLLSNGIVPKENLKAEIREMSLKQAAQYLIRIYGIPKSAEEICGDVNRMIEKFYREEASLKAGVRDFVEMLAENQVGMCIATATDRYLVEAALTRCGIRKYFSEIFTCSDVGHGKDEPVIFERAWKSLGTEKEKTWIFEDAVHALRTAKDAGFVTVGVFDRFEEDQKTVRSLSDVYIESFDNLKKNCLR